MHASLSGNVNTVLAEMHAVLLNSDAPEGTAWDMACAMVLGKQGMKPPWPAGPDQVPTWQIDQIMRLLRNGELFVISPAAHAAVMAAAATVEPGDVATLDRDRDIVVPDGLLVLPEPVLLTNRAGSVSDTTAFGWQFTIQHQILPTAQYRGVRVTTFMDRDGPVQPAGWQLLVGQARESGTPLPRLMPDGMYGARGDTSQEEQTDDRLANISAQHRELQHALKEASQWRAEPVPEVGEWDGGIVEDAYDDFTARYMFAFWRLAAQGVTTTDRAQRDPAKPAQPGEPYDPDVRVIRLVLQP